MQRCVTVKIVLIILAITLPLPTWALSPITYHLEEQVFTIDPDDFPLWQSRERHFLLQGQEIVLPPRQRTCREDGRSPVLPPGVREEVAEAWDLSAIATTLREQMSDQVDRPPAAVRIGRSPAGTVTFDGEGIPGRAVDVVAAARLTALALEQGIADVDLPVDTTPPTVTVTDPHLSALGVREVVGVGESDFSGSPRNRRHNIAVGLARLNGALTLRGETFSINDHLGRIDETTGFRPELVILGDRTLPEFGGGLCQVSTTVYRAAWTAGFPIVQRRNHSFAVSYYRPAGTDATIYPPHTDLQFANDGVGALLLQTLTRGDHAFAILYGTRDARTTDLIGPFLSKVRLPPPDRLEETTEIPIGTRRKLGERQEGFTALWFRRVRRQGIDPVFEPFLSVYEPRPFYEQIGVAPLGTGSFLKRSEERLRRRRGV